MEDRQCLFSAIMPLLFGGFLQPQRKSKAESLGDTADRAREEGWCVYVLRCSNNYFYIGMTNRLGKRLEEHERGRGSKFVRSWRPFELVKTIPCKSAAEARSLEQRLKRFPRKKKIELLELDIPS